MPACSWLHASIMHVELRSSSRTLGVPQERPPSPNLPAALPRLQRRHLGCEERQRGHSAAHAHPQRGQPSALSR